MGLGWGSLLGDEFWESEGGLQILSGGFSEHVIWMLNDSLDDVDGVSSGGVSTSHLGVHLGDGTAKGSGSVFLVHVHDIGSSLILKDDSVVFDG